MICSVSVDLDALPCYYEIHGLGPCPEELRETVMKKALPRFCELFEEMGVRGTFFVVGRDVVGSPASAMQVSAAAKGGHEIGNHSFSHHYDFARRPGEIDEEILRAHEAIAAVTGEGPVGFRAPGYEINGKVIQSLENHGYLYDSSIFPSPTYYGAKLAVLGAMKVRGEESGAIVTSPQATLARRHPYIASRTAPWKRGDSTILELPISVSRFLRIPLIGTSLLLAPDWMLRRMLAAIGRESFFNFELHGVDLLDAQEDRIPGGLVLKQPDLRVSLGEKRARLRKIFSSLESASFVPLREAATQIRASL